MKLTLICTFAILLIACSFSVSSAYPDLLSIDKFDENVGEVQDSQTGYDYRNSRLRRGYYYDDDVYNGYYPYATYSAPIRRADVVADDDIDRAYKYTPLVRYKATRTKRKKLFVPNLWG